MNSTIEENEVLQKEIVRLARNSRLKRRLITAVIIVLLILIALAATWIVGGQHAKSSALAEIEELKLTLQEQQNQIEELSNEPIVVSPISPKIDLEILHSEIANIGELATTEYLFTDASEFSDSKQIKGLTIPFTEKSFILRWSGVIKAGIELDGVEIAADEAEKTITVSVPAAKILSYSIDNDSVEVLNEKDNIFNRISVDDKINFDAKTEDAMKQRAIENGLLDKAQKNAETIIKSLIMADAAVNSEYEIIFVVKP